MHIETNVDLTPYNTLGLPALASTLVRVRSEAELIEFIRSAGFNRGVHRILGGGSNIVLSGTTSPALLKVEIPGRRLIRETSAEWIVEAGAGENWPALVTWTLASGWPGLENLALIPGTAGAAPIQNIGAYGVELKDRFCSLDAVDLETGRRFSLTGGQCRFGYRDSIFKHELAGRCMITRLRLRLPKPWRAALDYPDLQRRRELGGGLPDARQVYEWVCTLRQTKLPDPARLGNAGSFFKNPVVGPEQYAAILSNAPDLMGHPHGDGCFKLSAAWMIDACGWKGKRVGTVGVHDRQPLVLVNHGGATAPELLCLAGAIQDSVHRRFGIRLEIEPTLV